jgi:AraC-like DNA-binding protein
MKRIEVQDLNSPREARAVAGATGSPQYGLHAGVLIEPEMVRQGGTFLEVRIVPVPRDVMMEASRKIEKSIDYMTQHLDKPLHVADLAASANVSASHFFALFKRRTGCTPIGFFIHLRMHQACRLLDATSLSVKEIAAALGYDDPFYFSRIFKSVNHVAPSEYRLIPREMKAVPGDTVTSNVPARHRRPEKVPLPGPADVAAVSWSDQASALGSSPAAEVVGHVG